MILTSRMSTFPTVTGTATPLIPDTVVVFVRLRGNRREITQKGRHILTFAASSYPSAAEIVWYTLHLRPYPFSEGPFRNRFQYLFVLKGNYL